MYCSFARPRKIFGENIMCLRSKNFFRSIVHVILFGDTRIGPA